MEQFKFNSMSNMFYIAVAINMGVLWINDISRSFVIGVIVYGLLVINYRLTSIMDKLSKE